MALRTLRGHPVGKSGWCTSASRRKAALTAAGDASAATPSSRCGMLIGRERAVSKLTAGRPGNGVGLAAGARRDAR